VFVRYSKFLCQESCLAEVKTYPDRFRIGQVEARAVFVVEREAREVIQRPKSNVRVHLDVRRRLSYPMHEGGVATEVIRSESEPKRRLSQLTGGVSRKGAVLASGLLVR